MGNNVWACLFFFRNYVAETSLNTCTGHFRSLSLEEQFYMVWPLVLVLMGKRRASILVAGSAAVIALFRILTWNYCAVGLRALRTEVRADGLLVGCLLDARPHRCQRQSSDHAEGRWSLLRRCGFIHCRHPNKEIRSTSCRAGTVEDHAKAVRSLPRHNCPGFADCVGYSTSSVLSNLQKSDSWITSAVRKCLTEPSAGESWARALAGSRLSTPADTTPAMPAPSKDTGSKTAGSP